MCVCVCVCIYIYIYIYIQAEADWPSGEPGEFLVAWQPIWPDTLLFFYVVVFACRIYTKMIISEFAIQ